MKIGNDTQTAETLEFAPIGSSAAIMMNQSTQRLLNALAFANVGNYREFLRLIEKMDAPPAAPTAPAARPAAMLPAAIRSLFARSPDHLIPH